MTVSNSIFTDNEATEGNAIWSNSNTGPITITGSTFTGHAASTNAPFGRGGAIYHLGATLVDITDSTFDNTSGRQGGAIWGGNGSTIMVTTSTLGANTPEDIHYEGASFNFTGVTTVSCESGIGCQ